MNKTILLFLLYFEINSAYLSMRDFQNTKKAFQTQNFWTVV